MVAVPDFPNALPSAFFPDGVHVIGEGTIGPPSGDGFKPDEHYDCSPPFAGEKLRWCQAIGPDSWAVSSTGGRSFRLSEKNMSHGESQLIPHGANGLRTLGTWRPTPYDPPQREFNASQMQVYAVDPAGRLTQRTESADIRFTGLPTPAWEFSPALNRPVRFASGQWLQTVVVQSAQQFANGTFAPMGPCCNDSVVAFGSSDGFRWQFLSVVADKHQLPQFDEGPNENTLAILPGGKEALCIFRVDGGDGQPRRRHLPYYKAYTSTQGRTWSKAVSLPANVRSCRPRLITVGSTLILTGGRPLLSMWTSVDGRGDSWSAINLAGWHNKGAPAGYRFSEQFASSSDFSSGTACTGSTCYTSLSGDGHGGGVVCYNLYVEAAANASWQTTNTSYACMHFSVVA